MLEVFVFFIGILLIVFLVYTAKLFMAKTDYPFRIDNGRILDKDGYPSRQKKPVITL